MVAPIRSVALALFLGLAGLIPVGPIAAQVDPEIRERVVPAAVQIALKLTREENGAVEEGFAPIGSGTIVAPTGLILTNAHVVDFEAFRAEFEAPVPGAAAARVEINDQEVLVLVSDGKRPPFPTYTARVEIVDPLVDLAVLQITGDPTGAPLGPGPLDLPFVPLGDSDRLGLGDPIQVYGYPAIGAGALIFTTGVVSGFLTEPGIGDGAWVTTDAVTSGGSSGGTAVNADGELVGVPTLGSALDCRPGDINRDGQLDARDVGCVPTGGSLGQLRPVNLAKPLVGQVDPAGVGAAPNDPPRLPEPDVRPASSLLLPDLLPDLPVLSQGQPFRLEEEGTVGLDELAASLPDPVEAAGLLRQWGWQENPYRIYAADDPPPDAVGFVVLSIHRFATADGAAAALTYFAQGRQATAGLRPVDLGLFGDQSAALTGPAFNGDEVTIYTRRGNVLLRATGIAPAGDPTADVIEVVLLPLLRLVDEPRVASPELLATLPTEEQVPTGLRLAENHGRSAATIAGTFPDTADAERRFQSWGWRESAARVFVTAGGGTANGSTRLEVSAFRFADAEAAAAALPYFLDGRAAALRLSDVPAPAVGDEARAIAGPVEGGQEATVYVRAGPLLLRFSATGPGDPMADLEALLGS